MKKLQVRRGDTWEYVFCRSNGAVMTVPKESKAKALPSVAWHGPADLAWFQAQFGNDEFRLSK